EAFNDQIWKRFREAMNAFNSSRKAYFDKLNSGKEKNLEMKLAICEEAEKLAESGDMDSTAKKLIALQEKWKSIGPVPDAQNDKVWKRFRGACDTFFKKRE